MSDFYNKYPYTDFHELNLDWVIERVKKLTEDWLATQAEWNDTEEQWQQLHDYVMDYFANLNVQDEISNKINEMILDGSFSLIITPIIATQIPDAVADWMNAHLTPTTPVIDNTLSVEYAGADAKKTGLMSAPVYDPTSTYNANDFVNYNGTLFKCTTDITTPEAWDVSHWSATNLGSEMTTAITDIMSSLNLGSSGLIVKNLIASTDLNDLDIGNYRVENSTIAATILNTPVVDSGYKLIVLNTNASGRFCNIAICNNSLNDIYIRMKYNNTDWSGWGKLAIDDHYDDYIKIVKKIKTVDCDFISSASINSSGEIIYNHDYSLCLYEISDRDILYQIATDTDSTDTVYAFFNTKPGMGSISYNSSRTVTNGQSDNNITVPVGCTWIAIRCSANNPTGLIYPIARNNTMYQPLPTRKINSYQLAAFDRNTQNNDYRLQSCAVGNNSIYLIGCNAAETGTARLITLSSIDGPDLDLSSYVDIQVGHANDMTFYDGYLYIVQAKAEPGMDIKNIFKVDPADGSIVDTYTAPYGVGQIEYMNGKFYVGMNGVYETTDFITYTKIKANLPAAINKYAEDIFGLVGGAYQTFSNINGRLHITISAKKDSLSSNYDTGCIFCLTEDLQGIEYAYTLNFEDYEELQTTIEINDDLYLISDGLYYPTIRMIGDYKKSLQIPDGTDLDNMLANGEYYSSSSTHTATMSNVPADLTDGFHMTIRREFHRGIRQIIYSISDPCIMYTRYEEGAVGWSSWSKCNFS